MGYTDGSSVPPPENPATSGYPAVTPTSMAIGPDGGGHGPVIASTFSMNASFSSLDISIIQEILPCDMND